MSTSVIHLIPSQRHEKRHYTAAETKTKLLQRTTVLPILKLFVCKVGHVNSLGKIMWIGIGTLRQTSPSAICMFCISVARIKWQFTAFTTNNKEPTDEKWKFESREWNQSFTSQSDATLIVKQLIQSVVYNANEQPVFKHWTPSLTVAYLFIDETYYRKYRATASR